jgi:hypothetical protein
MGDAHVRLNMTDNKIEAIETGDHALLIVETTAATTLRSVMVDCKYAACEGHNSRTTALASQLARRCCCQVRRDHTLAFAGPSRTIRYGCVSLLNSTQCTLKSSDD